MRLIEKIDTSVSWAVIQVEKNAPNTANAPTARGSTAETTLPKTTSRSTSVMGTAMPSASPRSFITCWLFEAIMGAEPPTRTSVPSPRSPVRSSTSSVEISVCSASEPSMRATTMPVRPSSELRGSAMPGSLYAWTDSTPSCSRRSAAIPSPTSAESAAWEPSGARTRTTRLASPPTSSWTICCALADSEVGRRSRRRSARRTCGSPAPRTPRAAAGSRSGWGRYVARRVG